ncbi:hypothetical protein [Winogradskyella sp. A2]|uniref:hypothetical protein n=1 Tax=Winogradskyella sp. A2 TaxID=3366944 RepID=UPI00398C41A3
MKTLKITLTLVAIALLTVSGVQSEDIVASENSDKNQPAKIDLLASGKKKTELPTQG